MMGARAMSRWLATAALLLAALAAGAQQAARVPDAGYVYPAGGQQGAILQVTVGGQNLQGVSAALVSGEGVQAAVLDYGRALTPILLRDAGRIIRSIITERGAGGRARGNRQAAEEELPPVPDHPWFRDLETRSTAELRALAAKLFDPKKQPNAQIAELVLLTVTIDPDAPPGDRELRLMTPLGLTPPLRFEVGQLREVSEPDPMAPAPSASEPLELPVVLNGQVLPGEVDRFRLQARAGQKLVMAAQARRLIPYLADAVPGWFQAVLTLRDADGREVACVDDYRFDPDPVLLYEVPADGAYTLEIRDAIYRGREDFVYRVSVGELPFVTEIFPLGGRAGEATTATLAGWNLPATEVTLDTSPGAAIRTTTCDGTIVNPLTYAVDDLTEIVEGEPSETAAQAQRIEPPMIVNGRIARPRDVDCFRFEGRAGEQVVAEVLARRLGSPLDALLELTDEGGKVLAANDDHEDRGAGLVTHHADSYLTATLPADGSYVLRLSDIQRHGGDEYAYRLRVSPPRPDFELRVTPASISVPAGRTTPITVHVLRRDGFAGEVEVTLADAGAGLTLGGGYIPAGRDQVRMTLTAPQRRIQGPVELRLEGRAQIGGETVVRVATPAEDMMQAFAWRFLVPAQHLLAAVGPGRLLAPTVRCTDAGPLAIPAGGTAEVHFAVAQHRNVQTPVFLELSEPPPGLTLESTRAEPGGVTMVIKADEALAGYADNLIVEVATEVEFQRRQGGAIKQRVSLGTLPAIPYEVAQP